MREIARRLQFWMESNDKAYVYWIEKRGRGTFLQATPIDVSALLDEKLFDAIDTAILTSATLAVAGELPGDEEFDSDFCLSVTQATAVFEDSKVAFAFKILMNSFQPFSRNNHV